MIKHFHYIVFLALTIYGCADMSNQTDLSEKIKGDWKLDSIDNKKLNRPILFSFEDSTSSYISPFGNLSNYKLFGDTLFIKEKLIKRRNKEFGGKADYFFKVDSITIDKLYFTPITKETTSLFNNYYLPVNNQITLKKVMLKNDINFSHLGFYCTGCFGFCPSMYLEINSKGDLKFNGLYHTELLGLYSGKLNDSELNLILNKIRSIDLENLKSDYSANWTDDQTCGIRIVTSNGTFESNVYGFNEEPIELRLLFHKLMELYKNIEMQEDSLLSEKFKFKEFRQRIRSIPLPPPIPNE
jgi:uncharacterized protein DUF6438